MTIPAEFLVDDLPTHARLKLLDALTAANLLGTVVGADAGLEPLGERAWVFPGVYEGEAAFRSVEGTARAAVAMHDRTSWATNAHNTARFPVLTVLTFADCSRDAEGNITARDAELRAKVVARVVRDCFHDAPNEDHDWNGLSVISSLEDGQLTITDIPGGDGAVRAVQRFNVTLRR